MGNNIHNIYNIYTDYYDSRRWSETTGNYYRSQCRHKCIQNHPQKGDIKQMMFLMMIAK